jgi:nucleobase:cation symporter-1, NCS1 family
VAATFTSVSDATAAEFTIVAGDRHSEVSRTLAEPVPQALSMFDQLGLWANLGVSLLGFTGAIFVLQPGGAGTPELSLTAGLCAIVAGTLLGTLAVALSGLPGARTGAPAMVLLRGLFGAELSYLPTVLNILQCLGWGVFELVTIATAAHTVAPGLPRWGYVLIAGAATALLAVRPLGFIRILRRYVTGAVLVVLVYLFVQLARHPLPAFGHGTWSGFWAATDTVVAAAISFAPLAADYTRHSRTERAAFTGAFAGYSVAQILCYVIGLLALVTVARNPSDIYGAFIALPVGTIGFAILATRELDQSFANVYSTAVSTQNLRPLWDRRVLAIAVAAVTTVLALRLNIADYEDFLVLLGSVFVPMFAVLVVDFFVLSKGRWDLSKKARSRWVMLVPWAAGFVTYQLINPGYVSWWVSAWTRFAGLIGFTPASWMSASICSFVVAATATLLVGLITTMTRHRGPRTPAGGHGARTAGQRAPDGEHSATDGEHRSGQA